MKKILFINAVNPYSEVETRYPPLWPAYLSSYLEMKIGKDIFDYRYAYKNINNEIITYKPDIIAISSVTQNYEYARQYSKIAKEYNIPVIVGGIHITTMYNTLSDDMDIGCIGEGEETFFELVRHYLKYGKFIKSHLKDIKGIVYHYNGKILITPKRPPINFLNELPLPKREVTGYKYRSYIYTARGCQYNCVFCICSKYWGTIRYHTAERIIEEISELVKNNVKVIRIADENFTGNIKRLKKIADFIIANNFHKKVKFSCWCRANTITSEVAQILKSINIVSAKMGLESGNQKTLDYLKGNVTIEDNIRAIKVLKEAGIQVNGDFIIGSPSETYDDIMETYNFIKKMPLDFVDVNIFMAYPGTKVWQDSLKKGLVSNKMDWHLINIKFHDTKSSSIILSEKLTYEELYKLYRKFRLLIFIKTLKALFHTPWWQEIPLIIYKRIIGKLYLFFNRIKKNY